MEARRGSGKSWRGSGRSLGRSSQGKSTGGGLGRFGPGAGTPKWRQDGRRWRQDAAKMGQVGDKMAQDAVWLAFLEPVGEVSWVFLGVLGAIFTKKAEV